MLTEIEGPLNWKIMFNSSRVGIANIHSTLDNTEDKQK